MGTPVRLSNSLISFQYKGLTSLLTVWGLAVPSTWVTGWNFLLPFRVDFKGKEHKGGLYRISKIPVALLFQNRRGKRPEGFPLFYLKVYNILHLPPSGIAQKAAVSQCPGSPFHTPLKPAYQLTICKDSGDLPA